MRTIAVILSLLVIGGCGKERPAAGALGSFEAYRLKLVAIADIEANALAQLATATGPNYHDDATLLTTLRESVLPGYSDFVRKLDGLDPGNTPWRPLHRELDKLAHEELSLLMRLEQAVSRGDGTAVLLVNREQLKIGVQIASLLADFENRFAEIKVLTGVRTRTQDE